MSLEDMARQLGHPVGELEETLRRQLGDERYEQVVALQDRKDRAEVALTEAQGAYVAAKTACWRWVAMALAAGVGCGVAAAVHWI